MTLNVILPRYFGATQHVERAANLFAERQSDWALIDAGDVIVHVFRPEAREFYNLEKI